MSRAGALLTLAAALALLAAAPAARGDDVAEAKARLRRGAELYRDGKWREAIAEFEAAYRLKPHGAFHFNVAQCREKLGEWAGALRSYHDYLREVPDAQDRAAVRAKIRRMEERLAVAGVQALLVYSDPPGAEVRLDGRPRGTTPFQTVLPPGKYEVALALDGYEAMSEEVALAASASHAVDLVLRPLVRARPATPVDDAQAAARPGEIPPPAAAPRPPEIAGPQAPPAAVAPTPAAAAPVQAEAPAPAAVAAPDLAAKPSPPASLVAKVPERPREQRHERRVYTWVAAGTAVAAAAAGAYFGRSAAQDEDALASMSAPDGTSARRYATDAQSKARTANVLYYVAGGAAAAGVTLFFVEKRF